MARVVVDVMLKPEILDPQGQAVANALPRLGVTGVSSVRIGKRIEIEFEGEYVWNDQGGLVHWTHRDPAQRHRAGWVQHAGHVYQ